MSLYNKIIDLQKLRDAWSKVKSNKPACGIDDVTWEMFDGVRDEELKELNKELKAHEYECRPVKKVILYKNGKERPIALYCMRDKALQQSIAEELYRMYAASFSPHTYAYRKDSSALKAVSDLESAVKSKKYTWALKVDIHKFFDNIQWEILEKALRLRIREDDVLELIRSISQAPSILDGDMIPKTVGIYQGSSMSPVLSNVYLLNFDNWLEGQNIFFSRYSDDLVILTDSKEKASEMLDQIISRFRLLGLKLSEKKTVLTTIKDGFSFLGYTFDEKGKSVGEKAKEGITQKLETAWLMNRQKNCEERLQKLAEVLRGWEQYYEGKEPEDILEYATALYMEPDQQKRRNLSQKRWKLFNPYRELTPFLVEKWQGFKDMYLQLLEYEQRFFCCWRKKEDTIAIPNAMVPDFILAFEALMKSEEDENYRELIQLYADAGQIQKSEAIQGFLNQRKVEQPKRTENDFVLPEATSKRGAMDDHQKDQYYRLFVGRDDIYANVEIWEGKKQVTTVEAPLTWEQIDSHLTGVETVATFVQRTNCTAKYYVIDVDISRKIMLQCKPGDELYEKYRKKAAECAYRIGRLLSKKGMSPAYEFSGYRGYHVWLFFDNWYPVRYFARRLLE